MAMMFCWIISAVSGPVFRATSLVPASTTIAAGFSSMTSGYMRTSICGVVWPPMPRFTYGLPGKDSSRFQKSVIESPMKTTRLAGAACFFNCWLAW